MGMSTDVMVTVSVAFMLCVTISVCYEQKDEITVWDEVLPIKEEVLFGKAYSLHFSLFNFNLINHRFLNLSTREKFRNI